MKEIKLTFFASSTAPGMELVDLLNHVFANKALAGMQIDMKTIIDGDQGDMMLAGLRDDVVIFDASVEDTIGSNYKAAQMWPSCMEHFLVVSRTRLPLNFQPFHEGGTPDTSGNIIERPFTLDNHYLAHWIQEKLKFLEPQLPRPQNERLDIQQEQLVANREIIYKLIEKLISNSTKKRGEYRKTVGRAFVSYLSRYSQYYNQSVKINGFYVEDLIRYIKDYHNDPNYAVLYYPPGTLSSEFMTKHRRWQVVTIIDWRIRSTDEFWIFETDDYYDSWWTLAELASLAYIKHSHNLEMSEYTLPEIFICKPTTEGLEVRKVGLDFIQDIEPKLGREFGPCLSNSDPLTMGYELVRNMQMLRNFPSPIQWIFHKGIGLFMEVMMAASPMYQEMKKIAKKDSSMTSFNRYQEMIGSDVFSDSFWNDRIVTCPHCRGKNQAKQNYDFQKFLFHQQAGQFQVSLGEMQVILDSGLWTCEVCGIQFRVIEDNYPQFRWWPVRVGRPTGPSGVYVERIPVYSLQPLA